MTAVSRKHAHARVALVSGAVLTASTLAIGPASVAAQDDEMACDPTAGGKTYAYIKPGPDTWYQRDVDGFKFAAEADGNTVIEYDTAYDAEKELQNIANAVNEEVDGISMFSSTEAGATAAANAGNEAGIPVVLTDSVGTVRRARRSTRA
jgi:ribose transport system substrate-binding protein